MAPVLEVTVAEPVVAARPAAEPEPPELVLDPLMVPALATVTVAPETP